MKTFARVLLVCSVALMLAAAHAEAATITFSDTFNPADVRISTSGAPAPCTGTNGAEDSVSGAGANDSGCTKLQYTHLLEGFSNPPMTLTSAWLTVYAYNDGDTSQEFKINLDDAVTSTTFVVTNGATFGVPNVFSFNVNTLVSSDGQLIVNIMKKSGALYFDRSVLEATWETEALQRTAPITAVPEPASLILLGAGLVATAARLKRRRRN